jgi:hypothetical protein
MKPVKLFGIVLGALVLGAGVWLAVRTPGNVAETAENHPEPELRTRRYKTDLQTFVAETNKIVPTLSTYGGGWKLAGGAGGGGGSVGGRDYVGTATILVEVPVVVFTDDLVINAEYEAEKGETKVNIRSASRVGQSDFGENRRHVMKVLNALDEKFAAVEQK